MTVEETAEVLTVIRAGIPNAYLKLTDADAKAMVMLWAEMFVEQPKDLVMAAAKTYIWNDKSGKFPAPGALREEMETIQNIIRQCSYGSTLYEYMGNAADRFPPAAKQYMETQYRAKHKQLFGKEFAGQIERQMEHMRQLSAGSGEKN